MELYVLPSSGGHHSEGEKYAEPIVRRSAVLRHGADRDRTGDLCSAIAALSQLSYSPSQLFVRRRRVVVRRTRKRPRQRGAAPDELNLDTGPVYVKQTNARVRR